METTTPVTPVADPRDQKKFYLTDTPRRRALLGMARSLFRFIMKLDVHGLEFLPLDGPVILAASHVNHFDVFSMQLALPRPIFIMAEAELFQNPLMDVLIRNLSGFPVHHSGRDLWAMRHAAKVLNHGQVLGMFPAGTRPKGRGLAVAQTGTARLAIEAQCPILPGIVTGSDLLIKRFPHRAQVRITLLPLIHPRPGETPLALTDRMMFTLAQTLPLEWRGVYEEMPKGFQIKP